MIQVPLCTPLQWRYPLPYRGAFSHLVGTCGKWEKTNALDLTQQRHRALHPW
jgi:hypothetical protein